jgi:outer membrane biosynthesis protein TonB
VPGGLGLRFAAEAIFLVAVAALVVIADFQWPAIILAMALAWVLVSAIEWSISRRATAARAQPPAPESERPGDAELPQHVHVLAVAEPPAPELVPVPAPEPTLTPIPTPVLTPEPEPEPEPVALVTGAPEPEPEAEEAEPARPQLASVPEPPAVPEPVAAAEPMQPAAIPLVSRDARPREWNLWELERLARAGGGHNRVVDEERNYLLMYLREFANADGALPVDFDGLVRDSFGDLIGVG